MRRIWGSTERMPRRESTTVARAHSQCQLPPSLSDFHWLPKSWTLTRRNDPPTNWRQIARASLTVSSRAWKKPIAEEKRCKEEFNKSNDRDSANADWDKNESIQIKKRQWPETNCRMHMNRAARKPPHWPCKHDNEANSPWPMRRSTNK